MAKQIDEAEQLRAKQLHDEFVRQNRGANLRVVEIDGVAHPDNRDIRKRILDAGRSYPKKQIGSTLEQEIAAREAEVAAKKWEAKINDPKLSVDERNLIRLKRQRDAELDAEENQKRFDEHKQSPRVVKRLTEAALIRKNIVADPAREVAEIDFVDHVLAALSDPDAEPSAADALLNELRDSEKTRIEKLTFEKQAKIAALQGEIEQVKAGIVQPDETDEELEARQAERQAAIQAKFEKQSAERAERFERAQALVNEGRYADADAVMQGETV